MKNNLVFPLVVGVFILIATTGVTYYLRAAPDVRFTLSEPIPISFLNPDNRPEIIQLLEVKNLGNAKAERIQIKISSRIVDHRIESFSQDDKPTVIDRGDFEVIYPELPPGASFKVQLKAVDQEVNTNNLRIIDNSGPARPALAGSAQSSWLSLVPTIVAPLVYTLLTVFVLRQFRREIVDYRIKRKPAKEILESEKEWYLTKREWSRIVKMGLMYRISHDSEPAFRSESFEILSREGPDGLSDEDWMEVIELADGRFQELSYREMFGAQPSQVEAFLQQSKPRHLQQSVWIELIERFQGKFVDAVRKHYSSGRDRELFLKRDRPPYIDQEFWTRACDDLRGKAATELMRKALNQEKPYDYLLGADLEQLTPGQSEELLSNAYQRQFKIFSILTPQNARAFLDAPRPLWLKEEELKVLEERAIQTLEYEAEQERIIRDLEEKTSKACDLELSLIKSQTELSQTKDELLREYRRISKIDHPDSGFTEER